MPRVPPGQALPLVPSIRHYDWGDRTFIPETQGLPADGRPWAEAWFGAHPLAPARVLLEGEEHALDRLVAERPEEILGRHVRDRGSGFPYLLKILAAGRPLSIQVHPDREQAAAGFAREEEAGIPRDAPHRCYRDPHPKPEVLVALTTFHALCGFRSHDEIARVLAALPEITRLLPPFVGTPEGLRSLLRAYFDLPATVLEPAQSRLLARLADEEARLELSPEDPGYWALRAQSSIEAAAATDRGLMLVFLLSLVSLDPGQGLFLPAGVPHAYLHGAGVELMVSSDNVVRAGLTTKHVDADELLALTRMEAAEIPRLEAVEAASRIEGFYPIPTADFELSRIRLDLGLRLSRTASGPDTLLSLPETHACSVLVRSGEETLTLRPGHACLIPDGVAYSVEADGRATVFRAAVRTDGWSKASQGS